MNVIYTNVINELNKIYYFKYNKFIYISLNFVAGSNIKTALAMLDCIVARQLCFEDASCSAILEIIPRVCGPVPGKFLFFIKNF